VSSPHYKILAIDERESFALNSRDKAPFLFHIQVQYSGMTCSDPWIFQPYAEDRGISLSHPTLGNTIPALQLDGGSDEDGNGVVGEKGLVDMPGVLPVISTSGTVACRGSIMAANDTASGRESSAPSKRGKKVSGIPVVLAPGIAYHDSNIYTMGLILDKAVKLAVGWKECEESERLLMVDGLKTRSLKWCLRSFAYAFTGEEFLEWVNRNFGGGGKKKRRRKCEKWEKERRRSKRRKERKARKARERLRKELVEEEEDGGEAKEVEEKEEGGDDADGSEGNGGNGEGKGGTPTDESDGGGGGGIYDGADSEGKAGSEVVVQDGGGEGKAGGHAKVLGGDGEEQVEEGEVEVEGGDDEEGDEGEEEEGAVLVDVTEGLTLMKPYRVSAQTLCEDLLTRGYLRQIMVPVWELDHFDNDEGYAMDGTSSSPPSASSSSPLGLCSCDYDISLRHCTCPCQCICDDEYCAHREVCEVAPALCSHSHPAPRPDHDKCYCYTLARNRHFTSNGVYYVWTGLHKVVQKKVRSKRRKSTIKLIRARPNQFIGSSTNREPEREGHVVGTTGEGDEDGHVVVAQETKRSSKDVGVGVGMNGGAGGEGEGGGGDEGEGSDGTGGDGGGFCFEGSRRSTGTAGIVSTTTTSNVGHDMRKNGVLVEKVLNGEEGAGEEEEGKEKEGKYKADAVEDTEEGGMEDTTGKEEEKEEEGEEGRQGSKGRTEFVRTATLHKHTDVFGEPWVSKKARVAASSNLASTLENWDLLSMIFKGGDDCRQEHLAMQMIHMMDDIWKDARLPLWLRPYGVLITSSDSGLIETIPNATSVDALKKSIPNFTSLQQFFVDFYGPPSSPFHAKAVRRFAESMAAYSVCTYVLQVKDRHNGNIMLNRDGRIIHIGTISIPHPPALSLPEPYPYVHGLITHPLPPPHHHHPPTLTPLPTSHHDHSCHVSHQTLASCSPTHLEAMSTLRLLLSS